MGIRKNQKSMAPAEWKAFVASIDAMHGPNAASPAYRKFVALHVEAMSGAHMDWNVHTMRMGGMTMQGKHFLAWHRRFIKLFEERLQLVNPSVTIPYWDSVTDRSIPSAMNDAALLARWSVTRDWHVSELAAAADLVAIRTYTGTFTGFQTLLEGTVHAATHNAVGGNMGGASSPADPLFWLHHAFIDKLWADWQASQNGKKPPKSSVALLPVELESGKPFGVKIDSLLNIAALGYSYI